MCLLLYHIRLCLEIVSIIKKIYYFYIGPKTPVRKIEKNEDIIKICQVLLVENTGKYFLRLYSAI